MDSILDTIKESVNVPIEEDCFDPQICLAINGSIFKLKQLGLPIDHVEITDPTSKWGDVFGENSECVSLVKSYIRDNVRLEFDPPQSSIAVQAISGRIKEYEWRLNLFVDE